MVQVVEAADSRYVRILDRLEEVPREVSRLRGTGQDVSYDIETTDVDPLTSKIITLAFKPKYGRAVVIDVRHFTPDDLRMLGSMLEPLFDGTVELSGHNLKFDLEFALAQLGIGARRIYDTMLAEQVIFGMGMSSAAERGVHFGMADLAERYGLPGGVEKESRNWFIHLDERPEEWSAPLPGQQVKYIRQDVAVVHSLKEAQQVAIEEYGLREVIDLEMRALPALVGVEVYGVQIDREGWLSVIDRVTQQASELEQVLLLGRAGEFEGLAVHILKVREARYQDKWKPYEEWMKARDAFVATRKQEWEEYKFDSRSATKALVTPEETFALVTYKNWSEYKKDTLDWWYKGHEKLTRPAPLKSGVNLGSWMQVRDGFNHLGIPVTSVSEDTLKPYIGKHPLVKVYLDYSQARKIVTVYGREKGKKDRSFIELLDADNRLRASYQQIGADTGRMSSYSPNFQQIPTDGLGAELRTHVIAGPGRTLVVADFSNIELRIVAELSGDQFLLDAFASGRDVHAYTAMVMFGLAEEQATKAWTDSHNAIIGGRELTNTTFRKVSKTINYMLLYGAGVRRLQAMLEVPEKDAKALLSLYKETFSTAIAWLDKQKARLEEAKKRGKKRVYAETRAGRRRWFDIPKPPADPAMVVDVDGHLRLEVGATEEYQQALEEYRKQLASIKRQLANTPIQGLSADITKEACALWYERVGYSPDMKLVAVVHDESLIEATLEFAGRASAILEEVMMQAMQKYLHVVDLGTVTPVVTPFWRH